MALLQISEPGMSAAPHQHRLAAGIDLGTTNSLVASVRSGVAETLPDQNGRHILPSVVRYLAPDQAPLVGAEAKVSQTSDPLNTIASVKRLMGRGLDEVSLPGGRMPYEFTQTDSAIPRIHTVAGDVSPVEVSSEILKVLKQRAEQTLGGELEGVVITVPAYFDDAQRQATKDAARLAGLKVLRLLNEPTAAALAYGLDRQAEGVHAIYDLGGGTFDISILRLQRGVFEVMSTGGDSALGGDDMDHAIAEWIMAEAGIATNADHQQLRHLMQVAREVKETLSGQDSAEVVLDASAGIAWRGVLTRSQFNVMIEPLVARTLAACRRALRDAGITAAEVQEVVMVGGSTRVPYVSERVAEFFGRQPLANIDPDRVVALGASLQADILVGNKSGEDALLLDVTPLSLGIETMGGLVEKIIPRNTTIPVARAQEFTTFKDGQTAMSIHVVQGERELVSDCRSLARFTLRGIPPMAAGAAHIQVIYQVDADGLLTVTAREKVTGVESHIEVKPSYGLEEIEVERMLRESFDKAGEDLEARRLAEQQVEAERLLEAVMVALKADGRLLANHERQEIDVAVCEVQRLAHGRDSGAIREAVVRLERASGDFAARRMNQHIRQALSGQNIEDIK